MSAKPSRTPSIVVGVIAVVAFASAFFVIVSNGDHVPWAIVYTLQTVGFLALVGSLVLGRPAARARKAAGRGTTGSARPSARPNVDDWTADPD
jgi:peptidoglycan/LPS O-acetylase OafA/YrhL